MTTIHSMLLIGHVLVSLAIVALVLLQKGKGAEAGAAFGAGASGTVFGAKGSANFLTRSTAVMATLFFASSLALAYFGSQRPVSQSLMESMEPAGVQVEPLGTEQPAGSDEIPALPTVPPAGETETPAP